MPLDWAGLMRRQGEFATYTPIVGDPVSLYAKRMGGGRSVTVGDVRLVIEDLAAHVLRADVASPAAGDTLTIGGETWTVGAVEPLESDPQATRWSLRLTWGLLLTLRTPGAGGGGSVHDPVGDGVTLMAWAADAGAATVTLVASGWTAGWVRTGDVLTVSGAEYAVTADVPLSLDGQAWVFASVPITPVLASSVADGTTVTVTPPAEVQTRTVHAAPAEWTQEEIVGGIATADQRFVIRNTGIAAPTTSDLVTLPGEAIERQVTGVRTIHAGAEVAGWVITVAS